jgi:hypothetical protein
MMRFYFHFRGETHDILDDEGVESDDAGSVRTEALAAVAEFQAEAGMPQDGWRGWFLEVVDAAGARIAVIPLQAEAARPGARPKLESVGDGARADGACSDGTCGEPQSRQCCCEALPPAE